MNKNEKTVKDTLQACIDACQKSKIACHALMECELAHNQVEREECVLNCENVISACDACIAMCHKQLEHNRDHQEVLHLQECIKKCHDCIAVAQECKKLCESNDIHCQQACKRCAHACNECIRACEKCM